MSVLPDFSSDVPLRWIHRRDGATEIYFVANPEPRAVETTLVFRVSGLRPELWDPIEGTNRGLARYTASEGRTSVPLRFEPHQSFFIVFRDAASPKTAAVAASDSGANIPVPEEIATLQGPWDVAFDPKWGGPEKITFEALDDWSRRPEPGIKYYSGTAIYAKTFDLPRAVAGRSQERSRLARPGHGQEYRRCPAQRPRPRRRLVRSLAGRDHGGRQARGQPFGDPGRESLAQPAHRRRAGAAGCRIRPGRQPLALAGMAAQGRASPVRRPPDFLDLEALRQGLAPAAFGPSRPGESPSRARSRALTCLRCVRRRTLSSCRSAASWSGSCPSRRSGPRR